MSFVKKIGPGEFGRFHVKVTVHRDPITPIFKLTVFMLTSEDGYTFPVTDPLYGIPPVTGFFPSKGQLYFLFLASLRKLERDATTLIECHNNRMSWPTASYRQLRKETFLMLLVCILIRLKSWHCSWTLPKTHTASWGWPWPHHCQYGSCGKGHVSHWSRVSWR